MSELYDKIFKLCSDHGISVGKMCSDLGISRGNLTDLKMGRIHSISSKKLQKIADYFSVSLDIFSESGKEGTKKAPTLTKMASITEIIDQLCEQNGIKGSKLCDDLGISRSTLTELRKGRAKTLSLKKTQMIADYFGVSVEYLTGNQETSQKPDIKKAPTLTKKDERDIAKTLASLKETLENEEGLMFDGDPMSDEAKESILAAMELGLQAAKLKNKEKYTPIKYKKD